MSLSARGRLRLLLAALALAGCASGGGSSGGGSRDVVTEAQLANMEALNAFEALQRLKPAWLRSRGTSTLTDPAREGIRVYLDRVPVGDTEALKTVPVRTVQEIRFLDSRMATLEFGTDHGLGAILVTTKRGR